MYSLLKVFFKDAIEITIYGVVSMQNQFFLPENACSASALDAVPRLSFWVRLDCFQSGELSGTHTLNAEHEGYNVVRRK